MKRVGRLTYALCAATLDKMVLVNEGAVCSSILTLYNRDAIVVEPAGEWWHIGRKDRERMSLYAGG